MWNDWSNYHITYSYVTWLIHMCIHMWRDSYGCGVSHSYVAWRIHVWHDSFTCDMTHWCFMFWWQEWLKGWSTMSACVCVSMWEGGGENLPARTQENWASDLNTHVFYETLQRTLQHTAIHCNTLQHATTHCNTLQHTATRYNTLQHATTHCSTLQQHATCHTRQALWKTGCLLPQHTATH